MYINNAVRVWSQTSLMLQNDFEVLTRNSVRKEKDLVKRTLKVYYAPIFFALYFFNNILKFH